VIYVRIYSIYSGFHNKFKAKIGQIISQWRLVDRDRSSIIISQIIS